MNFLSLNQYSIIFCLINLYSFHSSFRSNICGGWTCKSQILSYNRVTPIPQQKNMSTTGDPDMIGRPTQWQRIQNHMQCSELPSFCEEDPTLWFLKMKGIFTTHRIIFLERQFQAVISQLPFKILAQIIDLARDPKDQPYEPLKDRPTKIYSQSKEKRIQKLLEHYERYL